MGEVYCGPHHVVALRNTMPALGRAISSNQWETFHPYRSFFSLNAFGKIVVCYIWRGSGKYDENFLIDINIFWKEMHFAYEGDFACCT